MFIDEVTIFVQAGKGGDGSPSMRREKFVRKGGPAGGNGGRGGDVVLKATRAVDTLTFFYRKRHFKAKPGGKGGRNNRYGPYGEPKILQAPVGTVVRDPETGTVLADLAEEGETFVLARGGRGGLGSTALTHPQRLARYAENGEDGEERWVKLELKLIADVGLVGFPNVGKSTLLSRVSRAKPKIADYPFSTVVPELGVVRVDRDTSFVMADIPGLVEGAHEGKGMGDKFLRHVERTRLLVHVIDVSGWEGRDPLEDWRAINRELGRWHPFLSSKPQVIAANKMDVDTSKENLRRLKKLVRDPVFPISAVTGEGVPELIGEIARRLPSIPVPVMPVSETPVVSSKPPAEVPLTVARGPDGFLVARGTRLERLIARTPLDNEYAVDALQAKLYRLGLDDALRKAGVEEGEMVRIGKFEFLYYPDYPKE